jgi:hypothetical protein
MTPKQVALAKVALTSEAAAVPSSTSMRCRRKRRSLILVRLSTVIPLESFCLFTHQEPMPMSPR